MDAGAPAEPAHASGSSSCRWRCKRSARSLAARSRSARETSLNWPSAPTTKSISSSSSSDVPTRRLAFDGLAEPPPTRKETLRCSFSHSSPARTAACFNTCCVELIAVSSISSRSRSISLSGVAVPPALTVFVSFEMSMPAAARSSAICPPLSARWLGGGDSSSSRRSTRGDSGSTTAGEVLDAAPPPSRRRRRPSPSPPPSCFRRRRSPPPPSADLLRRSPPLRPSPDRCSLERPSRPRSGEVLLPPSP